MRLLLPRFLDAAGLRNSMRRKARTKRQSSSSSSSSSSGGDPIVIPPLPDDSPEPSSSRVPAANTAAPAQASPDTSLDNPLLPTQTRTPLPPPVNMPTDQDESDSTQREPETSLASPSQTPSSDDDNDTVSRTDSRSSTSPFIASTSPLPSQPSLPTPATRPSSDSTDTDTDEDEATRTTKPEMPPSSSSKSRTERPSSSPAAMKGTKGNDGHKLDSSESDVKKTPATTYVAIAFGCLGGLLLIMALSAYYRRWRRKRRLSKQVPDDEFVSKSEDPPQSGMIPPSPTLTTSSYMTEDKSNVGPSDWKNTDLPDVPPLPAVHQPRRKSRSRTSSGTPDPAIPPDMQEFAGHLRPQTNSTTVRSSSAPIVSIETRGHTRTFSRPASELVLGGSTIGSSHSGGTSTISGGSSTVLSGDEPASPSKIYPHRHPNARHNSYASNKYESLRPPSQRASMPNGPERFS